MSKDSDMVNAREQFLSLTMACMTISDPSDAHKIRLFISEGYDAGWMAGSAEARDKAEAFEWLEKRQDVSIHHFDGPGDPFLSVRINGDDNTFDAPTLLACIQAARKGEK